MVSQHAVQQVSRGVLSQHALQVVSQHALQQVSRGVLLPRGMWRPPQKQTATVADGTHPTGMHSCMSTFEIPPQHNWYLNTDLDGKKEIFTKYAF